MNAQNRHELYLLLMSMYFNMYDGEYEFLPDLELLEELIEVVNEASPGLSPDQYLS